VTDEIKQSGTVERVTPPRRTREGGRRKQPPRAPQRPHAERQERQPADRGGHHVDEYA
jgi:hypothetical protein